MDIDTAATDPRPLEALGAPAGRVYSPGQVAGAAFLGSPIAGCVLLASNWRLFAEPDAARNALLWGGLATVALFAVSLFLPENFPSAALPAAYTAALYQIAQHGQGERVTRFLESGGTKQSHGRVIAIGLGCMVGALALFVAAMMLVPAEFLGLPPVEPADSPAAAPASVGT